MTTFHNPALREEPRNQPVAVIPLSGRESLLSWLENTGRFDLHQADEPQNLKTSEDLDDILEPDNYVLEAEEDNEEEL